MREAGIRHPQAEMVLWVDSKRLTEKQMAYLKQSIEEGLPNVHLKDLRSIRAYGRQHLYNKAEKNSKWRNCGQTAVIWRQVDAAKILVSLQGNYDQTFFADLDHAHLDIGSRKIQGMLKNHGLMIGSSNSYYASLENQLWGFDRSREKFFKQYYTKALIAAYLHQNAYSTLLRKVRKDIVKKEKIPSEEICLLIDSDGTSASQPGSRFSDGYSKKANPSLISTGKLATTFNANNQNEEGAASVAAGLSAPPAFGRKLLVSLLAQRYKGA